MPTTQPDDDPQRELLSAVRESQAAVIEVLRAWTDLAQQVTHDLRLPIARVDLNDAVDRVFDVAEQTLAAQREFARSLAGVATRQVEAQLPDTQERVEQPQAGQDDAPKSEPARQDRRFDGRTYEERSVEELRERAAVLQIEGRSTMSKDELIAALRHHRRSRSARGLRKQAK
jgi:hypothetical protein